MPVIRIFPSDLCYYMGFFSVRQEKSLCLNQQFIFFSEQSVKLTDIRNPLSLLAHEHSRFATCQWELLTPTDISIPLTHRLVLHAFDAGNAYSAFKTYDPQKQHLIQIFYFELAFHFAPLIFLCNILTFIVHFFTAGQSNLDFDQITFDIHFQWNQRITFLCDLS